MNNCGCDCGAQVKGRYKRGHARRKVVLAPVPVTPEPLVIAPEGPPAHPLPIDRRRWRLAGERPGTPLTDPWIKTNCQNCLLPMWTRDPLSTWEHGGICEECDYVLRTGMADMRAAQQNRMRALVLNPFRNNF